MHADWKKIAIVGYQASGPPGGSLFTGDGCSARTIVTTFALLIRKAGSFARNTEPQLFNASPVFGANTPHGRGSELAVDGFRFRWPSPSFGRY
jgi:hypothetical protein